ncbi:MAG: kinase [Rheinheimera sp.]|uniref:kinase n=1 Tax=Arsukibacterium sp. UBA3155 TaxID=1946058 RepID=UPI000C939E8A|nr:kinase [Arsukibacterium sp. UBA3155]MAD73348.1 kinase [Rheinheimera sp.]|tara:strand:- start:186881 stop:187708 length:828 start_codon:yes stop_codon:yes gene_type:complete
MADFIASNQYQATLARLANKLQTDLISGRPKVMGISGAQGTGKSTLASALVQLLSAQGIAVATVSLDDYYLSKSHRQQLAQRVHPLLAMRGVPGSHNIQRAINDANAVLAGKPVSLPQFDKALDEPDEALPAQQYQLLIVEGWCLGVKAQSAAELNLPVNALEAQQDEHALWRHYVNAQLAGSYADYWRLLTPLIWLQAPDWDCVCRWRAKQEQQLRQSRGKGMNEHQLAHFMQTFERLTQASWQQLPTAANYIVRLDQQQTPTLLAADKLQHRL